MEDDEDCFVFPAITKPYSQITPTASPIRVADDVDVNQNSVKTAFKPVYRQNNQYRYSSQGIVEPRAMSKSGSSKYTSKSVRPSNVSEEKMLLRVPEGKDEVILPRKGMLKKSIEPRRSLLSIHDLRKYSVIDPTTLKFVQEQDKSPGTNYCGIIIIALSYLILVLTLPFSLFFCVKVIPEYERAVIFRLGRILSNGARGPGLFFVLPCLDVIRKIDLRTVTFDVPPQEVLTKDSVTVAVDAVVYYRIYNPVVAVTNVEDADRSTRLLAATTLRNVLGTRSLSEILSERESISGSMQAMLDDATDPWGVKVERVEVKDVRLPLQLQRAMAAEAEATREARAKVIAAEGEHESSGALKLAADVLMQSPCGLHLRYLQTLSAISAEKNSTIIFPLPIGLIQNMLNRR